MTDLAALLAALSLAFGLVASVTIAAGAFVLVAWWWRGIAWAWAGLEAEGLELQREMFEAAAVPDGER